MEFDDLHIGMRVRIIDWMEIDGHRPDHWQYEGYMDDWCGEEVTISDMVKGTGNIYIEEDDGDWQWYVEDFENLTQLPDDDPNIQFVNHKRNELLSVLRERIADNTKAIKTEEEDHDSENRPPRNAKVDLKVQRAGARE